MQFYKMRKIKATEPSNYSELNYLDLVTIAFLKNSFNKTI